MKDIKIIEELIKRSYNCDEDNLSRPCSFIVKEEVEAISNLLNDFKKYKEEHDKFWGTKMHELILFYLDFKEGKLIYKNKIVDKINSKIKELQYTITEIQGTEHEGETVLYLMEIDLLQKLLLED